MEKILKPQIRQSSSASQTLLFLHKPFITGNGHASFSGWPRPTFRDKCKRNLRLRSVPFNVKAVARGVEKEVAVKGAVTVQLTVGGFLSSLGWTRGLDDISDLLGKTLLLELVSADIDPSKYDRAKYRSRHDVKLDGLPALFSEVLFI